MLQGCGLQQGATESLAEGVVLARDGNHLYPSCFYRRAYTV
jgi:hypothetical protein